MYSYQTIRQFFGSGVILVLLLGGPVFGQRDVSVVSDSDLGVPVRYGLAQLKAQLEGRQIQVQEVSDLESATGETLIVAGLADGQGAAARLLNSSGEAPPSGPESLIIFETRAEGKRAVVIVGADERGLMYALLDTAERVGWAEEGEGAFAHVRPVRESADAAERSMCKMVVHPDEFEQYCFDESYWDRYLSMLAKYRYNTFHLLFGYESRGYFEPFFPYVLEVEEYPEVRVLGVSPEKRAKNLEMLQMITRKCREYGLNFTLGIWTHIYRTNYVYQVRDEGPSVTRGITAENLVEYNEAALAKLLELVPDIDTIQFRVHVESSLQLPEQQEFWTRMLETIRNSGHPVRVDMRAKGFTDDLIEASLSTGVPFRMATKYWGEKLGMAHHPTHLEILNQFKRRHGYANLLRYPKAYDMLWRLWSHGTVRLLHWFNPRYVRDFTTNTHLYDGAGYEVQEPLPTKLWHHEVDDPVDHYEVFQEPYRFYDWEFERYWPYYLVFGRLGYSADTPAEVWLKEFQGRFGEEAGPLMAEALTTASEVLPRILGYSMPNLNASSNLPETSRNYDLPRYASERNLPGDDAMFAGLLEAARFDLAGVPTARIHPRQTRTWFDETAAGVEASLAEAIEKAGNDRSPEFDSMVADLKILAGLARYHARRIDAGLNYAYFEEIGDIHALDEAIRFEKEAITNWESMVSAAEDVYADELIFEEDHHWRHELEPLREGLVELEKERSSLQSVAPEPLFRFDFGNGGAAPGWHAIGYETEYNLRSGGFGWLGSNRHFLPPPELASEDGLSPSDDFIQGPVQYNFSTFVCDLEPGSYRLKFIMEDSSTEPQEYGPMWFVINGVDETDHFTVPAGERKEVVIDSFLPDENLSIIVKAESDAKWLINGLEITRVSPQIAHVPVARALPGEENDLWATVSGVAPITRVTMTVGNPDTGYSQVELNRVSENIFRGTLPSGSEGERIEYFLEAYDEQSHRSRWPRKPLAFQKVRVSSDRTPPTVEHSPVREAAANQPLRIVARARDNSGVAWLHLRYRSVNQHQDHYRLQMLPTGRANEYAATIPAEHVLSKWNLMYHIETMDQNGNGAIVPGIAAPVPYVVVELDR